MKRDNVLYEYVYDSLITQFYRGLYKYGDYLPPFGQLCEEFGVSNITIRKAIHLLVQDNYLAVAKSKHFRVIFNLYKTEHEKVYLDQLTARKDAIFETYDVLALLVPALFVESVKLCADQQISYLEDIVNRVNPWFFSLSEISKMLESFFIYPLSLLKNPIVNDFILKAHAFVSITYLPNLDEPFPYGDAYLSIRRDLKQVLKMIRAKQFDALRERIRAFYIEGKTLLQEYAEKITQGKQAQHKVPLHWYINGKIPSLSLSLACELVRKIERGEYPENIFLPPPAVLAQQFQISQAVVRRTIAVMNSIGITQTINGKGTKVKQRGAGFIHDLNVPAAGKTLKFYINTLQFLLITCKDVTHFIMAGAEAPDKDETEEAFAPGGLLMDQLLCWVVGHIKNPTLKTIYHEFSQAFVLGYCAKFPNRQTLELAGIRQQCEKLIERLKTEETAGFSQDFQKILYHIYRFTKTQALQLGCFSADEIITPCL